jgi:CDP-4-dehydro-6-deoxyglucose reductase
LRARLTGWLEIGPNTRHFEFEALDWNAAFVPGQFISVIENLGEDEITRAYSIASPPGGGKFALCANLVQDGRFTPFLFGMQAKDEIAEIAEIGFKGPYGGFILRRPVADSIFVATGTGIAPFRSMLMAQLGEHPERRFTLIFGVRHEEGLLYHAELLDLAARHENFDYRPTLTRPGQGWTGLTGRVQGHVLEALGGRRDMDVYMCGMREMIDDLRAQLKVTGLDRRRMIYEKYD